MHRDDELNRLSEELSEERRLRQSIQAALSACEQKYHQLMNHAPAGIYEVDFTTNKMISVNDVICRYTGYSREELLRMDLLSLLSPESRNLFLGRLEMMKIGHTVPDNVELKIQARNGREFWVQLHTRFKYQKDRIVGATVVVHDVDQRKQAELALKASEERYRTILESIGEGYFEVDLAGDLTFFNDAVLHLLGYSRQELMGMNLRAFSTAESACRMNAVFDEVYRTGIPGVISNYELVRKEGTQRHMELSIHLMRDQETQKNIGFRGFVRDISARRSEEERRRKLEKQLQMAQKLESIGTLAGGVAHDFNNLMMSILGNVSLIQYDLAPEHPYNEKLKNIVQQVQRGAKLTSQLLSYARKGKYALKQFDLNHVILDTSEAFGRTHKQIAVALDLKEGLPAIEADKTQIEQVLLNLYVNAADAMSGGGHLLIRTDLIDHVQMTSKTYAPKPGHYVCLYVTDAGIGMDETVMSRIFDPFFTTKDLGQGTGLGLASVYGIVKAHKGYIDVTSSKGKGSTFSIYLPVPPAHADPSEFYLENLKMGHGAILISDDEQMVLDINAEMLERIGFKVFKALGGQAAIELYKNHHAEIDLVIIDMVMPKLSGSNTYNEIKKINPRAKVLLSSGYSLESEARKIMERGCNGFIQKPFGMQELADKIAEVLKDRD